MTRNLYLLSLLLTLLINLSTAKGQTLHFIVFADTDDPSIGGNNLKTYSSLTGNNGLAQNIAQYSGLKPEIIGRYATDCRADELDKVLSSLNVGKDDVVFFYFAGHGFNSRQNDFPSLIVGKANADPATITASARSLSELYARIQAKNPRMTIAIADACNTYLTDPPIAVSSGRAIDIMPSTSLAPERIKALFRNWQGGILMSSSRPKQSSHSDSKGGWMSISLENAFNDWCSLNWKNPLPLSWKTLLDDVKKRTETMAQQNKRQQNPQFVLNLTPFVPSNVATTSASRSIAPKAEGPCPALDKFVNERALAGIREDMPLLRDMNEHITTDNAEEYAQSFSKFYTNQKSFYDSLNKVLFNRIGNLSPRCQQQFDTDTKWVQNSANEVNERYQVIQKYSERPRQLVQQARSDLPSIIRRLEEILEKLDK
ncbi:caspase family protein [Spirosoma sp. BT702]|uniref:Caspase family protein n=1 Tax=Spirosoma profusum TaxID=2771354 RepID=A0A927ATV2_9BACT|nr:caspase family protein [Spirosoma profusum]MBD2704490.1 caspase family protein [Spirosoma profusum]